MIVMCGVLVLMEADLRAPVHPELFATDASSLRAGGCRADLAEELVEEFFGLREEKGEYVRLDKAGGQLEETHTE